MTLRRPRCETWGWACSVTTLQMHANAASERPPRERRVTGANTPARGPSSDAAAPGHKRAPAPAAAGGSGRQLPRPPRQPGVALLPEAATRPLADEWTALGPWSQCLLRPQQVGHAAPATKDRSPAWSPITHKKSLASELRVPETLATGFGPEKWHTVIRGHKSPADLQATVCKSLLRDRNRTVVDREAGHLNPCGRTHAAPPTSLCLGWWLARGHDLHRAAHESSPLSEGKWAD